VFAITRRILKGTSLNNNQSISLAVARPKFFYGYVIVVAALFMSIVMWGARVSFGVFFAPVLDEFGWTRAATSGGFSATWVFTGLLSIGVGKLNDQYGPRLIMTVAGVLVGLGYLLMARLSSIWQMYLFYGVISVGMSAVLIPTMSTVARWFIKLRAFMTGIVLAGTSIALMVILPVANWIILLYGWRTAYVVVGVVVIAVVVIAAQFLRRDPYQEGLLPYGFDAADSAASRAEAVGLSFREALRTNQVWLLSLAYFCTYFIFYTVLVHLVIHATGQGISSAKAIRIMAFFGGAGIAGRLLMGVFAERIGNRRAMLLSAGFMALSLFWLLAANEIWMLFLFGTVFGFGHGGIAIMESLMVANIFGTRSHGVILGLVFFCDTIGGATGPVLSGYIFDVTKSYKPAFLLCAVLGVVILAAILLLKPLKHLRKSA
jgi:MFS family permease